MNTLNDFVNKVNAIVDKKTNIEPAPHFVIFNKIYNELFVDTRHENRGSKLWDLSNGIDYIQLYDLVYNNSDAARRFHQMARNISVCGD